MAYAAEHLEIVGHCGDPVPNTFWRQRGETAHVGVVLPGAGYTCQMPLLYYPTRLLLGAGADVLQVEYAYLGQAAFRALPDDEQERRFFADVEAALRTGAAQRAYGRLTLVGKSLGTLAMGHLLGGRAAGAAAGRCRRWSAARPDASCGGAVRDRSTVAWRAGGVRHSSQKARPGTGFPARAGAAGGERVREAPGGRRADASGKLVTENSGARGRVEDPMGNVGPLPRREQAGAARVPAAAGAYGLLAAYLDSLGGRSSTPRRRLRHRELGHTAC